MRFLRLILVVIVVGAALAAPFAVGPTQMALADKRGQKGHNFEVTFTKWITSQPANPPSVAGVSMAGVVGGDVGDGRFAGKCRLFSRSMFRKGGMSIEVRSDRFDNACWQLLV